MTRLAAALLIGTLVLGCSDDDAPSESTIDACSNGRDDDGDGAIDCADPACRAYVFCVAADGGIDAGVPDAAPLPDGAVCARSIDVVMSVDVSSSMDAELAALRDASAAMLDRLRAIEPGARVSLVVFVDDALALAQCAPLDAEALARELEAWRVRAPENRSPVSGTFNQDCAENSLDALALAASCGWRDGAARIVLHVTDDTFAERPAVLSGPFGGGIVVQHTYREAGDALAAKGARIIALTRSGQGENCGAGRSEDVGRGFDAPYDGMPSLPERTGGEVHSLVDFVEGRLDLPVALAEAARIACE